jgi:hypothetical protein
MRYPQHDCDIQVTILRLLRCGAYGCMPGLSRSAASALNKSYTQPALEVEVSADIQPFLAARHGFLLEDDGSFEATADRKDSLEGREDGSLVEREVGLL